MELSLLIQDLKSTGYYLQNYAVPSALLNIDVAQNIVIFLKKYSNQEKLTAENFNDFRNELNKIENAKLYNEIVTIIHDISKSIYESFTNTILEAEKFIENNLTKNKEDKKSEINIKIEEFQGLLNIHCLMLGNSLPLRNTNISPKTKGIGLMKLRQSLNSPMISNWNYKEQKLFQFKVPLAVNALILSNKLQKNFQYGGVDFEQSYPSALKLPKEKIPLMRGIKDSQAYIPYKLIAKILDRDNSNPILLATNGNKIIYMRGGEYRPNAILASKIATFVSKDHFSSERLFDIQLTGSKKLVQYNVSALDSSIKDALDAVVIIEKKIIPGTGIIDEVLNFVHETDRNLENIGFSTSDFNDPNVHVSKIDFDGCNVTKRLSLENYEQDILTKPASSLYHGTKYIDAEKNIQYVNEKLFARLKLSILSNVFIKELSEKAYLDQDDKEKAIKRLADRTEIALALFMNNPHAKYFLENNLNIMNDLLFQSINYVNTHFDEDKRKMIINSIFERIKYVQTELINQFHVALNPLASLNYSKHIVSTNSIFNESHFYDIYLDNLKFSPATKKTVENCINKNLNIKNLLIVLVDWNIKNKNSGYNEYISSFIENILKACRHANNERIIVDLYNAFTSKISLHRLGINAESCQPYIQNMVSHYKNQYRR